MCGGMKRDLSVCLCSHLAAASSALPKPDENDDDDEEEEDIFPDCAQVPSADDIFGLPTLNQHL